MNKTLIGFITFFVFLLLMLCYTCNQLHEYVVEKSMVLAANDTLKTKVNSRGEQTAEIKALYGTLAQLQELHAKDSSTIWKLQKLVSKQTLAATVLKTETAGTVEGKTIIIYSKDTTCNLDKKCYPTYVDTVVNRWENMTVFANKDSIKVKYKVFNDFSVENKFEKVGKWPFRKNELKVQVLNHNPRTQTKELQSFVVQTPKPKRGRWLLVGLAGGFVGGIFLVK